MVVATWNVNSIRSRLPRVLAWLQARQPDVLCLQELKTESALFPFPAFWALGYGVALYAEKHWNGVAILSRRPMTDIALGFGDGAPDVDARLVAATIDGVRILSAYVPHGRAVGHEEWSYKLGWLRRLRAHLDARHDPKLPLVLCGDFNVAPESKDVWAPDKWTGEVHFHPDARVELRAVAAFGLHDLFRMFHPGGGLFSYWDYKTRDSVEKNRGLRIDHIFATEPLARRCVYAAIDSAQRLGEHPSDHVPVLAAFND